MNEQINDSKAPYVMELEAGTYWWCTCGQSTNQPFCNGAHRKLGFIPTEFSLSEKKTVAICKCRLTKTKPFCDGSHKSL